MSDIDTSHIRRYILDYRTCDGQYNFHRGLVVNVEGLSQIDLTTYILDQQTEYIQDNWTFLTVTTAEDLPIFGIFYTEYIERKY